ncbi:MAG TPA: terminase small subunit [Gemmataceae bacterium]|jgi:phage terminase small subunit|nr:terminase small subunit [Gemmataceae bacterium]
MLPNVYADNGVAPLTAKQEKFVREWLIDGNATRAAHRAGYSLKSAHDIGSENLRKPEIKQRIAQLKEHYAQQAEISAVDVLREMKFLANSDIREVRFAADGSVDWDETPAHAARAIQVLEVEKTDTRRGPRIKTKVRMYDKRTSLITLMEHLGLVSAELPPLEVLLNRLPPNVASIFRRLLSGPDPDERARLRQQQAGGPEGIGDAAPPPS